MGFCSVKWCGKSTKTSKYMTDGITFHRFPKSPAIKTKWIDATHRGESWFPRNTSVICSRHFTADNFHRVTSQRRRLLSSAVPTLYLPVLAPLPTRVDVDHSTEGKVQQRLDVDKVPSTSPTSHLIDDMIQQHNNSAEAGQLPCPCDVHDKGTSNKEVRLVRDPESPSAYDTPVEKRLSRRIMELKCKVNEKNIKLRKVRDANRRLKREIISLKSLIGDLQGLE